MAALADRLEFGLDPAQGAPRDDLRPHVRIAFVGMSGERDREHGVGVGEHQPGALRHGRGVLPAQQRGDQFLRGDVAFTADGVEFGDETGGRGDGDLLEQRHPQAGRVGDGGDIALPGPIGDQLPPETDAFVIDPEHVFEPEAGAGPLGCAAAQVGEFRVGG